jgi:hypothetical protein
MTKEVPPVLIIIGAVWVISGFSFFSFSKDAKTKRKWWPWFHIVIAILLACIVYEIGAPASFMAIAAVMITLLTLINIRTTKFCDACGGTLSRQNLFFPPKNCSRCGAKLHDESPLP